MSTRAHVRDLSQALAVPDYHWNTGGWNQALSTAKDELKLLFIYLHCPLHQDTASAVGALRCPGVAQHISSSMVHWTADVTQDGGNDACQAVQAAAFPYMAVVAPSNSRLRYTVAWQHVGEISGDELLAGLQHAEEQAGAELVAARADQAELVAARQIREEQERRYEESLAQDRARAEQRAAAQRAEAARVAAIAAADAARQAAHDAARQRVVAHPEPAAAISAAMRGQVCTIRLHFSDGSKVQRRFRRDQSVLLVRDYALCVMATLSGLMYDDVNFRCQAPSRTFERELWQDALADAGNAGEADVMAADFGSPTVRGPTLTELSFPSQCVLYVTPVLNAADEEAAQ